MTLGNHSFVRIALAVTVVAAGVVAGEGAQAFDPDGDDICNDYTPDPNCTLGPGGLPDNCLLIFNATQFNPVQVPADPWGNVCNADFDQDGAVTVMDFGAVMAHLGPVPATPWFDLNPPAGGPYVVTLYDILVTLAQAKVGAIPGP